MAGATKDTAHGLLPQAEEAPSWKWSSPEETGSPQGSWALVKDYNGCSPPMGLQALPAVSGNITLRDGRSMSSACRASNRFKPFCQKDR